MYATAREHKERGCNNRRWTTQTPSLEAVANRGRHPAVPFLLTDSFCLSIGTVVWLARLFIHLLVRLQNQDRALRDLRRSDCAVAERDVPPLSTALRRLRFREPNDYSQQPTVSVLTDEIHSRIRLGRVDTGWSDLRISSEGPLAAVRALL